MNQQHRPGREDRSGGMEACQTGPLQRSVRPLGPLGPVGSWASQKMVQGQVGQGQGGGQEHPGLTVASVALPRASRIGLGTIFSL